MADTKHVLQIPAPRSKVTAMINLNLKTTRHYLKEIQKISSLKYFLFNMKQYGIQYEWYTVRTHLQRIESNGY